jgi:5-methylcytosine-specific restriction endonuclease McrA
VRPAIAKSGGAPVVCASSPSDGGTVRTSGLPSLGARSSFFSASSSSLVFLAFSTCSALSTPYRKVYQAVKWNRGARVSSDPRVRGHRHDQTVAGVLAAQLGMRLSSEGLWVSSGARRTMPIDPKTRIVLVLISSEVRKYVCDHDGGQYQHCGATQNLEFDYIIPLSQGGLNTEKNLQVLCASCIRSKVSRSVE